MNKKQARLSASIQFFQLGLIIIGSIILGVEFGIKAGCGVCLIAWALMPSA